MGNDWLTNNQAIINNETFSLTVRGRKVQDCAVLFSQHVKEKLICGKRDDDVLHIQAIESSYDG